jgi:hypothetical protein
VIAVVAPDTMRRGDVICVADLDASGAPLWEVEQSATCPRTTVEKWRRRWQPPRRAGAGARPRLDRIASKVDRPSRTRDGSSGVADYIGEIETRELSAMMCGRTIVDEDVFSAVRRDRLRAYRELATPRGAVHNAKVLELYEHEF